MTTNLLLMFVITLLSILIAMLLDVLKGNKQIIDELKGSNAAAAWPTDEVFDTPGQNAVKKNQTHL